MISETKKAMGILSLKEQYTLQDKWLGDRIQNVMPKLMKECGINLYIVLCGEYNEDPVFKTITPALMFTASRTSCLMFSLDDDGSYHAWNFCAPFPSLLQFYEQGWNTKEESQWDAIHRKVREYAGKCVAVNVSSNNGQADGLTKRLFDELNKDIGDAVLTTDTQIAIRWLETRTQEELDLYPEIYRIAMTIQNEAYSRNVITPGVTTTTDVEWYILERINELGMGAWFSPDVDLQRKGSDVTRMSGVVIEEGDLLHTDMGITYLGLNTDSQRLAYVLKEGETEIPAGILAGFARGNRWQDIVRENMIENHSGNRIFMDSMKQAKEEGLRPMLYTHPIGYYGHGSGPLMGLYTAQGPVPVRGEIPLKDRTCYALELNTTEYVPEWGQDVTFYMEETVAFADGATEFMDPEGRVTITKI